MYEKLKPVLTTDRYFYAVVLILLAVASFGLGRLSAGAPWQVSLPSEPSAGITLQADQSLADDRLTIPAEAATESTPVASEHGARYYLPHCSGVGRINPDNLIYFVDTARAEAAGYTPAARCFE